MLTYICKQSPHRVHIESTLGPHGSTFAYLYMETESTPSPHRVHIGSTFAYLLVYVNRVHTKSTSSPHRVHICLPVYVNRIHTESTSSPHRVHICLLTCICKQSPHQVHIESTSGPHLLTCICKQNPHRVHIESASGPHLLTCICKQNPHRVHIESATIDLDAPGAHLADTESDKRSKWLCRNCTVLRLPAGECFYEAALVPNLQIPNTFSRFAEIVKRRK